MTRERNIAPPATAAPAIAPPERHTIRPSPHPASPRSVVAGSGDSLLSLQRSLGNRVVNLLLAGGSSAGPGVIQRKKGDKQPQKGGRKGKPVEEDEVEEEEGEGSSAASAPVNSSASMKKTYESKVAVLVEALEDFSTEYAVLATQSKITAAKSAIAKVRELEQAIDEYVGHLQTRLEEVEQEIEAVTDDYGDLIDEEAAFGTLIRNALKEQPKLDDKVTEEEGRVELAAGAAAASGETTRLRGLWASPALAVGHFSKHKGDTGLATEGAYLARAEALCNSKASATILQKVRGDGDTLFFDKANGHFSIKSVAGKIRTLFKPGKGVGYYNAQT